MTSVFSTDKRSVPQHTPILRQERNGNESLPSFAQQRLWFFDQLEPDDTSYTMIHSARLHGPVDFVALKRSLEEIIRRHESLRTVFQTVDGAPVQVIQPPSALNFPYIDLSAIPAEEHDAELRRLATQETQTTFDLVHGPLVRTRFIHVGEQESALIINMHHIITDGWSMGVLQGELAELYNAFTQGLPSPLPELPIQYADYAVWQKEQVEGEASEKLIAYWKNQLEGVQPLELPTDRVRPAQQSYRGAVEGLTLSPEMSKALKDLSRREKVSLFMLLLASFQLLLSRYSGQDDIAVGVPIANRTQVELEKLIGYFVNPLVMRTDLSGDLTFHDYLRRVRDVCLEAYAHQNLPFEKILEAVQPERDLSRSALFQATFTFQNTPQSPQGMQGITQTPLYTDYTVTKFDLTLLVEDLQGSLKCVIDYSTDLFNASTIKRMLQHLQQLFQNVIANPNQKLADISLLNEQERHQLLVEWNATETPRALDRNVHELITEQAHLVPDRIALVCEDHAVSYGELEQRSNQIAHYLRKRGVGPEHLVGLALERSIEMAVALLGIFKAGAAYVPLDPNYPADRIEYMMQDSGVEVLITLQELLEQLPTNAARDVICLDRDWAAIAQESTATPANAVHGSNMAVIIYTSGSTGRAKGVQIEHRGLLHHLYIKSDELGLTENDRVIQCASHSFVISVWQFLAALIQGGQVNILKDEATHDPAQLLQQIMEQGATIFQTVPSLLHIMLEDLETLPANEKPVLNLRWIMPTGEALPTQLCQRWLKQYPEIPLMNTYGSTECSDDVTHMALSSEEGLVGLPAIAPVGQIVGNMQAYLLDEHLSPVPIGVAGELYIGGIGLTRGYLGRPELTAERFIPNPFSNQPGARLYRMGDRARYLPDGTLEYLGRADHLVKLRGFRIELGEIESVLRNHPTVSEAAVMVREDIPGNKRLVAYLVAKEGEALEIPAVRSYLKQQLPDYMVPATFVVLEAMPLLANGKLNRRALPAPDQDRSELGSEYVAPRTETERRLAEVWCQVLGLSQVGIHDNFFDSGGDSLLGIRMIALAHKVGVHLTPKLLMQYQTISELLEVSLDAPVGVAEQGPVVGSYPLIPMQGWALRHWPWKNPHRWNFAYLFLASRHLDYRTFYQTIYHLMHHHDGLREGFKQDENGWHAYLPEPNDVVPLTWVDLSDLAEADQTAAIESTANALQGSLNLFKGQAFRIAYFDLGPERQGRFMIILHLLIADAFSLRIMLHDIQMVYGQLSRGEEVQLPDKTTSVKQWAETLDRYVASPEMKQEVEDYWLKLPWDQAAPLPVDHPEKRGTATTDSIRKVVRALTPEETNELLAVMTPEIGILDILMTALLQAFHPLLGSRPLPVGIRELGRQTEFDDIEPPANTVGRLSFDRQLLLGLDEDSSLPGALIKIKGLLDDAPQRGIGHNLMTHMSQDPEIKAAMRAIPFPEILVNHTGQMQQAFSIPDELSLFAGMASENVGPTRDPGELLDFPFFLISSFSDRFAVLCEYSSTLYEHETVEELIQRYVDSIKAIVKYLQEHGSPVACTKGSQK